MNTFTFMFILLFTLRVSQTATCIISDITNLVGDSKQGPNMNVEVIHYYTY